MPFEVTVIIVLAILFGFYMAWGIGANDVANAMGTSVGSGALTLKRAVILAAVLEFSGAFFVGMHVSETVRKGIIDPAIFANDGLSFMLGMLASLLSAGVWLQIASYKGWPVSTTHSIVGAILGFGAIYGGMSAVHWDKVGTIVASWVVSPALSGVISYLTFRLILNKIFRSPRPVRAARRMAPYLIFAVFSILTLAMVFKGLKNLKLDLSFPAALGLGVVVGTIAALVSAWLLRGFDDTGDHDGAADELARDQERNEAMSRSLRKATKHLQRIKVAAEGRTRQEVATALDQVRRLEHEIRQRY
jgi:phosphate/sulfate permease